MSNKEYKEKINKWNKEDFLIWKKFNLGLEVKEIKKKSKRRGLGENRKENEIRGIENIINAIESIKPNEYIIIDGRQIILPQDNPRFEMSAKGFKKRTNAFYLKRLTIAERMDKRESPQKMLLDIIKKESETYIIKGKSKEHSFSDEDYPYLARRGFHWYKTNSTHVLMPQVDILKAIILSSLIIHYDRLGKMRLTYSNPGGNFNIDIPSRENPKNTYQVKLKNLVTELPDGYGNWVNIEGITSAPYGSNSRIDLYSNESNRTKHSEMRLNHTVLTALILRQHFNDERLGLGKFKSSKAINRETNKSHPIPRVLLNIVPLPTEGLLKFYLKLQNNVLISKRESNSKGKYNIRLKKLNQAQEEALISVRNMLLPRKAYQIDDQFNTLDKLVYSTLKELQTYTGYKIRDLRREKHFI